MSNLPVSWINVKLSDVVDYGNTLKVDPSKIDEDSWILELEDIEKKTSKLIRRAFFSDRQSKSTKNKFEKNHVLYGKLRPYLDKVIIADTSGYCTTEIIPLNPGNYLDSRFLFYCLKRKEFLDYVSEVSHGLNMPRLGTKQGREAPFVLAPLNEQTRIADKLDSLLTKVRAAQSRLEKIPLLLKRFRQSVLAAATSGELTKEWREENPGSADSEVQELYRLKGELIAAKSVKKDLVLSITSELHVPEEWKVVNLGGLASKITDGEHKTPQRESQGRYLLSARNVRDGKLSLENVDFVGEDEFRKLRSRCDPDKGDILISCSGSVGRIALCDRSNEYVMVRSAALVKTNLMGQCNKYIMYTLQSPVLQKIIVEKSKATAQANLFLAPIGKLPIPYAPFKEQKEIVRRIESLFALADVVDKQHLEAKKRIDHLIQSLLTKAFRGELVPQDPNDEPAAVLLKQIQTERVQQATNKSNRQAYTVTGRKKNSDIKQSKSGYMKLIDLPKNYLLDLLTQLGGEAHPKVLWSKTNLTIDDFYAKLKLEMQSDSIVDENVSSDPTLRKLKLAKPAT